MFGLDFGLSCGVSVMECTALNDKLIHLAGYAVLMIGLFLLFMSPPEGRKNGQALFMQIFSSIGLIIVAVQLFYICK